VAHNIVRDIPGIGRMQGVENAGDCRKKAKIMLQGGWQSDQGELCAWQYFR